MGYRVRLDSCVGPNTRVELVTDGLFLRLLQEDPALSGVSAVLFDEVHERGIGGDLALALTWQARQLLVPDLAVVAMSATLDAEPLARLLDNAPVLSSEGRAFPVETIYAERPAPDQPSPRAIVIRCARRSGRPWQRSRAASWCFFLVRRRSVVCWSSCRTPCRLTWSSRPCLVISMRAPRTRRWLLLRRSPQGGAGHGPGGKQPHHRWH